MESILHFILLIIIANGAPVFMHYVFGDFCAWPVDFGRPFLDGRPLLGESKTWRGLIAAVLVTPVFAALLGYSLATGLLVAVYSMLGDMSSSFIKRRIGLQSSSMAPFLDQIPEALLPAIFLMDTFNLSIWSVMLIVLIFIVMEILLSRLLYKWGVRKQPY
ncbi:MAG: CDP-archaeol synthase [Gammaproteobacteria bacterium]|nr:CDP-archaeol synthase [Gammaproteobacteria bacterium]